MNYSSSHLTKDGFFQVLRDRLSQYAEVIQSPQKGPLDSAMRLAAHHNIERIKQLDAAYDFFGSGVWGYGINRICDGINEWNQPDFQDIARMPGLNKHHEQYRILVMLIFKVVNDSIALTTLAIDSCQVSVNFDHNIQYPLQDFINATIKIRASNIFMNLKFANKEKPVSFQIETFHLGGRNLSGQPLAQYYKTELEKIATSVKENNLASAPASVNLTRYDFLEDLIACIRNLFEEGNEAPPVKSYLATSQKNESEFRDYFCRFFRTLKYLAEPESKKGLGRIDLKIYVPPANERKIVEFKGWWNQDKKEIVNQLCSYLTDFENNGYIFMVNNTRKSIVDKYRQIIQSPEMGYFDNSWQIVKLGNMGFEYYRSRHNYSEQGKTLHHFIFNIFSLTTGN